MLHDGKHRRSHNQTVVGPREKRAELLPFLCLKQLLMVMTTVYDKYKFILFLNQG